VTRAEAQEFLATTRERCLAWGGDLPWEERGAILELLGSAERALFLIARIIEERRSVPRAVLAPLETTAPVGDPGLAPA
jgi:phosphate:Na+ symporter